MKSRLASLFLDEESREETTPGNCSSPESYTLMIVDDEPEVRDALRRVFHREHYRILTAGTGEEGLAALEKETVHVIISDHRMPGITGAEFLGRVKERWPQTIRIMLTAHADISAVMGAINTGAVYKFITKPWNDEDLRITVSLALEQHDLIMENQRLRQQTQEKTEQIKKLARYAEINRSQFLNLLVRMGHLSPDEKEKASRAAAKSHEPYPHVVVELGYLKENEVASIFKSKLGVDRVYPKEFSPPEALTALFPEEFCRRSHVFPLKQLDRNKVLLVMSDPSDLALIEDIRFLSGLDVVATYAPLSEIDEVMESRAGKRGGEDDAHLLPSGEYDPYETIEVVLDEDEEESLAELTRASKTPPAIKLVNMIFLEALKSSASDIHLEKRIKYSLVRFRVDGLMRDHIQVPDHLHQALVSRIKVMAELDISERRRPQDGRITVKTARRTVDIRISILPTITGEKVVMRILDRNAAIRTTADLGADPEDIGRMMAMIQNPQGMVLATGPTGSGKTTTLYTLLSEHVRPNMNYVTIEDPVEYHLEYAGQVLIRDKIGLNFATVLRSILRQDPNVILLGEIRDFETAEVAFHAALTGHLVMSTLHTTSTVGTIARLLDLGVKPFIIASGLAGIIAQRLVRRLCPDCREPITPDPALLASLGADELPAVYRAKGCRRCNNQGYVGRLGLYEILTITPEVRAMISRNFSEVELHRLARSQGMRSLRESGLGKAAAGETSLEEILRVLGPVEEQKIACPHCRQGLSEISVFCPHCGRRLGQLCPDCHKPIEPHWSYCGRCGQSLDPAAGNVMPVAGPGPDQTIPPRMRTNPQPEP